MATEIEIDDDASLPPSPKSTAGVPPPEPPTRMTYTKALDTIGAGAFHWKLLCLCGWVNASDAVEILAVSFILPSATDDLNLTSSDKGLLAAVIFLGMMFGGWIWGSVADRIGRRSCLILSLLVNSLAGFLSAFVPTFWWLMALRFFGGLGVGGSIPVVWSYFAEFLPISARGSFMVYMAMFWMVGSTLIAGLAWLIIPQTFSFDFLGLEMKSWRIFSFLCGFPALSSVFTLWPSFESPRWLLSMGDVDGTINILKYMHRVNRSGKWCGVPPEQPDEDQFDSLVPEVSGSVEDEEIEEEKARLTRGATSSSSGAAGDKSHASSAVSDSSTWATPEQSAKSQHEDIDLGNEAEPDGFADKSCRRRFRDARRSFYLALRKNASLFKPAWRRSSILCSLIFFGLAFGSYGMSMFIPQYFTDMEDAVDVYLSSFLSAVSNLPGNIVSVWSVRAIGRGRTLGVSLFLSSIAIFLVLLCKSGVEVVVMMCVFSGMSIAAWNASNIIVVELFPTRIRSTAFGFFAGLGRIGAIFGNLAFGEFNNTYPAVPIVCVAICLCISAISSMLLPDTRQVQLS